MNEVLLSAIIVTQPCHGTPYTDRMILEMRRVNLLMERIRYLSTIRRREDNWLYIEH